MAAESVKAPGLTMFSCRRSRMMAICKGASDFVISLRKHAPLEQVKPDLPPIIRALGCHLYSFSKHLAVLKKLPRKTLEQSLKRAMERGQGPSASGPGAMRQNFRLFWSSPHTTKGTGVAGVADPVLARRNLRTTTARCFLFMPSPVLSGPPCIEARRAAASCASSSERSTLTCTRSP